MMFGSKDENHISSEKETKCEKLGEKATVGLLLPLY
jgi:hypothetical protein